MPRGSGGLCEVAGRHFNRGQRAFFFALGYLGWFISPWLLMVTSVAVAVVLWRRQFASDSRRALIERIASAQEQQHAKRRRQHRAEGRGGADHQMLQPEPRRGRRRGLELIVVLERNGAARAHGHIERHAIPSSVPRTRAESFSVF